MPARERLLGAVPPAHRARAAAQLASEIPDIIVARLPAALPDLLDDWIQNVATQLVNGPAELRIEQWIYDQSPGLRPVQARSLLAEVARCAPSLDPVIVALTPPTVYRATMAMNAAQAWHVARLVDRPELLHPFERAGLANAGRELSELVLSVRDTGNRSDIAQYKHS